MASRASPPSSSASSSRKPSSPTSCRKATLPDVDERRRGQHEHHEIVLGLGHDDLGEHAARHVLGRGDLLGGEGRGVLLHLEPDAVLAEVALEPFPAVHQQPPALGLRT